MTSASSTPGFPDPSASLPSGSGMPLLGFGTWQLTGDEARQATEWALEAGYRHLDTAAVYRNEREVGAGLAASGLPRQEVFVTTKLPPNRSGRALGTLHQSLEPPRDRLRRPVVDPLAARRRRRGRPVEGVRPGPGGGAGP